MPPKPRKRINLALQGGGAHGAFTWGVLDRLLESGGLDIVGICGTSAGAMNAAVVASGLCRNGDDGGRAALSAFWERVAEAAGMGPLQPTPLDRAMSRGNMDWSPFWLWYDNVSRVLSPYQLNPGNWNPLREVLEASVDCAALGERPRVQLFLCATNVLTGRIKVFSGNEISVDAVLASACLPFLHQAVEIDGQHYWDGGFMGNPPLFPLIYGTDCEDVLIVQINPINIEKVPTNANDIFDRMNELSFNSSLMREMRTIHFVTKLLEQQKVERGRYKKLNVHTIDAEAEMRDLGYSSKLNADRAFLDWLFNLGRAKANTFLDQHFDAIGERSSTDIETKFL